jgi:SAM-dependent methyltransferase
MGLYVQYGCGLWAPEGWQNFDASPTLLVQKIPVIGRRLAPVQFPRSVRRGDIRKGLSVAEESVDAVYCSHVLEHLALDDLRLALRNTLRILRPGGIVRLVMPDLKCLAKKYVGSSQPEAAIEFMKSTLLGRRTRPAALAAWCVVGLGIPSISGCGITNP